MRRQLSESNTVGASDQDGSQRRELLQGYTPETCNDVTSPLATPAPSLHGLMAYRPLPFILLTNHHRQACVATLGPSPNGFILNLYYENGQQVCTCCRECEGVRFVPR